jgi:hypothetical protein
MSETIEVDVEALERVARELKPRTKRLLRQMSSRRECRVTNRLNRAGYWIIAHPRVRSVADYARIASFPRAPKEARQIAERIVNGMVAEARRFEARRGGTL